MRTLIPALAAALLLACSGTEKVTGAVGISSPVAVSSVSMPVGVSSIDGPVTVSRVSDPVAVSGIGTPVTVAGIATPVAVAGIATPVTVAAVEAPVTVQLARPELDPARIETGTGASGSTATCAYATSCRMLVQGPFILTDVIHTTTILESSYYSEEVTFFAAAGDASTQATPRWSLFIAGRDNESGNTSGSGGTTTYAGFSSRQRAMTGMRLAVRGGENLYLSVAHGIGSSVVTWSGFRP